MTTEATAMPPGIYFGLDEDVYHEDRALSRSNCVDLRDTPRTYWDRSWMNAERKRKPRTDPMEYGSAFHYLLFQPKEFEKRYRVVGVDQWDDTKKKIAHEEYFAIIESIKVLREGEDSNLFLTGGKSEVTIVFDCNITGLRYRCRHDYMTPVCTTDFKTARTLNEGYLKAEFKNHGLDIQLALYKRSRLRFKEQFLTGEAEVYGQVDRKWFEAFMASEMNEFMFIFQRKDDPYPYQPLLPEDDTEDSGNDGIFEAAQVYHYNMKKYGPNVRWPACDGKTKSFSMFYGIRKGN